MADQDQPASPEVPINNPPTTVSPTSQTPVSPAMNDILNATTFTSYFQNVVFNLEEVAHKGSAGRIGVLGGSRFYTGAPYFSAMSTLRLGGDLSYVITTKAASPIIKTYSPELIVCPVLDAHDALVEIGQLLPKIHSLVIGPGLGKEGDIYKVLMKTIELSKEQRVPLIFDADAMFLLTRYPEIVRGYKRCMITPNAKEYDYLASKLGLPALPAQANESLIRESVRAMSLKFDGVVVVRKGMFDVISDGNVSVTCNVQGSPRRCGGQGDVLAGACGLYAHWSMMAAAKQKLINSINPIIFAAFAACTVTRTASLLTYRQMSRSMLANDLLSNLGAVYKSFNIN